MNRDLILIRVFYAVMLYLIALHLLWWPERHGTCWLASKLLAWLNEALVVQEVALLNLLACYNHAMCRKNFLPINICRMTAWLISYMAWHNDIWFSVQRAPGSASTARRWRIVLLVISRWAITHRGTCSRRLYLLRQVVLMTHLARLLMFPSASSIRTARCLPLSWMMIGIIVGDSPPTSAITLPRYYLGIHLGRKIWGPGRL